MARVKAIELTDDERAALEHGWQHGPSRTFRQRCQMILLKSQWLTSQEVADQVGCCKVVVNTWLKRYQAHRLDGLKTRQGRGRRPILHPQTDLEAVRRAVQKNRQRVRLAKAELQEELGKEFSTLTLKRFLRNGGPFKRVRRRLKHTPQADLYEFNRECLAEFEQLPEQGHIELFYGDESGVSLLPCVPYAW